MLEEARIRDMCLRVLIAEDGNRDRAIEELGIAVRQYLEDQSDEIVLADLLNIPDVAATMRELVNKRRAS